MFSCNDKFNRHYELSEAIYKQKNNGRSLNLARFIA